jgi:hypothetical protein
VRENVKKKPSGQRNHHRLASCTEYLQCKCGVKRLLLLQSDQWHQTTSCGRYVGFPLFYALYKASVSDDAGLLFDVDTHIDYFRSKPVNIPKITILLDHGYHPEYLTQELKQVCPQMMKKIKFELSTKPSKQEKAATGKSGFVPAIARWGSERSNAWMERCKILVKNHERTLANATTKLNLCFVKLMLKRLAVL